MTTEDTDDFASFMRRQTAEAPRPPRRERPQPDGARQAMLLTHLDDNPDQRIMFEEEP
jgi:hypothetical protein